MATDMGWRRWLALAILLGAMGMTLLLGWDQAAAALVRPWEQSALGRFWGLAAYWSGQGWVQGVLLGAVILAGILSHRRALTWTGLTGVSALALTGLGVQVAKHLVGRPRPRLELPAWEYFGPTLQSDLLSFPSGHAATSFAVSAVLASRYPRLGWLFHLAAALVSAGRVVSGSHHLSDVLGGAVLGLAVGWPLARRLLPRGAERA